jgi:hypothetical protein
VAVGPINRSGESTGEYTIQTRDTGNTPPDDLDLPPVLSEHTVTIALLGFAGLLAAAVFGGLI